MADLYVTERAVSPVNGHVTWLVLDRRTMEPHGPARDFVLFLRGAGRSSNTVRTYVPRVTTFLNWCLEQGIAWQTLTLAEAARFKWWIESEPGAGGKVRAPATVNLYLTAVCEFLRFCAREDLIERSVADRLSEPRYLIHAPAGFDPGEGGQNRIMRARVLKVRDVETPPATLTAEQCERILQSCGTPRQRFLVQLLLDTGLRIGEALGLRRSDMHFLPDSRSLGCDVRGPHVHVVRRINSNDALAKSVQPRTVPASAEVVDAYIAYQVERGVLLGESDSDYVLVNLYAEPLGEPMRYSSTKRWFDRTARSHGFDVRPHMFRHTAGTRWLHEGEATVDTVRVLLGHASIASTTRYLHPTDSMMRDAVDRVQQNVIGGLS